MLEVLGESGEFVPCLHSVGKPLLSCQDDAGQWPCAPLDKKYIAHFPEEKTIWSYGSGYGGNALLGKKCLALRIASVIARDEGWMAEHMLILKLTNPEGKVKYVAAAFPSACGKTNLAMLVPTIPGWKVETIGDDIAWMKPGKDGRLYAINPEAGFFGVAPGTSHGFESERHAFDRKEFHLHERRPDRRRRCLVGRDRIRCAGQADRLDGQALGCRTRSNKSQPPAAHPNARFTAPAAQCPSIAPEWEDPAGVPIDAFLFGGRRPSTIPLVTQAFDWNHGVFMGSIMGSRSDGRGSGPQGRVRAPRSVCHAAILRLSHGRLLRALDPDGRKDSGCLAAKILLRQLVPQNQGRQVALAGLRGKQPRAPMGIRTMRRQRKGRRNSHRLHACGRMPSTCPAGVTAEDMSELLKVDIAGWKAEIADVKSGHYPKFGSRLPKELMDQLDALIKRLG